MIVEGVEREGLDMLEGEANEKGSISFSRWKKFSGEL